ncbi:MAG: TonB-dependent receptor [Vulcanimicrobiaceae bacterium]
MSTTRMLRFLAALLSLILAAILIAPQPAVAQGQASVATITGTLVDQLSGLPVANARVSLYQVDKDVADTTSDSTGAFRFQSVEPGVYYAEINAIGYQPGRSADVYAFAGQTTAIRTVLVRATSQTGGLREIASVTAHGGSLQTSSVIIQQVSPVTIQREGLVRVAEALTALPGISANDLDSAPGDDLHINIRGLPGSETSTLIDGHPIGPIGVGSGQRGGYNYQLSPPSALSNVQVAYGTGGLALYGTNTIGGAVDFQTLEPSLQPAASFQYGFGTQGRQQSIVTATGTTGRLGYALEAGAQGTTGDFQPGSFTQNGLLLTSGTTAGGVNYLGDVSPSNVAFNSYPVSGNYIVRTDLLKLHYAVTPKTTLTATGYLATSWDDKSGEGDNDALSPAYVGAQFDAAVAGAGCVNVKVTDAGVTQCLTRNQFVNAFSGGFGGGGTAWQGLRNQDYSLRMNTVSGHNQISAETFSDTFNVLYDRFPKGTTTDNGHVNNYQTVGEQIGDDLVTDKNDLGFGVYAYNQREIDQTFDPSNGIVTNPTINEGFFDYYLRDSYTPAAHFSVFASAWVNQNSVTNSTSFNPRLALVYRPTPHDVVRFSAGEAEGVPQVGLMQSQVAYNTSPTNITNPNCALQSVASSANPTLTAERANDLEASVGHQFTNDTNLQVTAFDMNERNVLFSNVLPLTSLGLTPPSYLLAQYLQVLQNSCASKIPGYNATIANLGSTTVANAGAGRFQGITFQGRVRFNRNVFVDFSYDTLSARYFGIPQFTLQNNLTLIDGGQIGRVPPQQGNLGIDYSDNHGFEARLDGFYVGNNNGLQRPPYTYFNGFISKQVKTLTFTLGGSNIFNNQYDQFGRIGEGVFIPENQYGTDATALQEAFNSGIGEQFGMPARSIVFSVTQHFK